jgi:Protein of unknown function (DUF2924)
LPTRYDLQVRPPFQFFDHTRELFDTEPPAYNRRFLESRLAYRIQELAYGGLSRDRDRFADAARAAFQHIAHAELAPNRFRVDGLVRPNPNTGLREMYGKSFLTVVRMRRRRSVATASGAMLVV